MNRPAEIPRVFIALLVTMGVGWTTQTTAAAPRRAPMSSGNLMLQDPRIIVRVHNYAHIEAGILLDAEAVATKILSQAKIKTTWAYCPLSNEEEYIYPICPADWGTTTFVLNLLTPEMAARMKTPVEALGSAPSACDEDATSCPISVVYLRVKKRADQSGIPAERVLGHVLAHEVRHILGVNHSPKGIMRGEWGRDDLKLMAHSLLEFSAEQGRQLQTVPWRRATRQERTQNGTLSRLATTITVLVYNYARVSEATLVAAEHEANRILGIAGARVDWIECQTPLSEIDPKDLCRRGWTAQIPGLRLIAGSNKYQEAEFASTAIPVLMTIYYEHVARRAHREHDDLGIPLFLGCIVAHELGHLLLADPMHSTIGIMQPEWGHPQFHQAMTGNLLFTAPQATRIRAQARLLASLRSNADAALLPHIP